MPPSVPASHDSSEVVHEKGEVLHKDRATDIQGGYAGVEQDEDLEPEIHWKAYMVLLSNSSTLIAVVFAPPLSRISDLVGRKWITVTCGLAGVLGCILIASAKTMGMAIAGGTLAGFLVAMQGPYSAIVSEVTPRRYRSMAQGWLNLGPTLGGILGATASQKIGSYQKFGGIEGWRASFAFAAGGCFFAVALLVVFYNPPKTPNPENRTYTSRWLDFDVVGTCLLTAAITPLTIGLTWGGGAYPWKSVHAIAPTAIGAVLLVVFGLHQTFIKKDGLFHHGQFKGNRNFALSVTGNFVEGIFYYVYNAYIGTQAAILYESAPLKFGLFFASGYLLFVVLMIGLAQTGVGHQSQSAVYAISVMAGVAFVPAETLLQTVAQLAVPADLIGTAAALGSAVRSFGGLIGVAIATSIFNSKVAINLPKYIVPVVLEAGLPASSLPAFIANLAAGNIAALEQVPGVTAEIIGVGAIALKQGFAQCFKYIWYFEIPFMVLALVAVSLLTSVKEQMNWIINRPVEEIIYKHGETVHHKERHSTA
ncbi:hypothetical protein RQP46_002856 [Phenoliferia psychrophenolica]